MLDSLQYKEGFCTGVFMRDYKNPYLQYSDSYRFYANGFTDGRVARAEAERKAA